MKYGLGPQGAKSAAIPTGGLSGPTKTAAGEAPAGLEFVAQPARRNYVKSGVIAAAGCAIAAASIAAAPGRAGLFGGALGLLMLAIAIVDAHSFRIPDKLTIAAFLLGLADASSQGFESQGFDTQSFEMTSIALAGMRAAVAAAVFLCLREIYWRMRRRHGIGLGDVKLAAVAGAWLEATSIPLSVEIAALAALSYYGTRQLVLGRPINATAKLPFGLFFAPAIWLCWLLQAAPFAF